MSPTKHRLFSYVKGYWHITQSAVTFDFWTKFGAKQLCHVHTCKTQQLSSSVREQPTWSTENKWPLHTSHCCYCHNSSSAGPWPLGATRDKHHSQITGKLSGCISTSWKLFSTTHTWCWQANLSWFISFDLEDNSQDIKDMISFQYLLVHNLALPLCPYITIINIFFISFSKNNIQITWILWKIT